MKTAGEVLLAYLTEQVDAIATMEPLIGSGEGADGGSAEGALDQNSIHKTRVATRRLRSVLASYRRLLHREHTDPLRDELRWLAAVLGGVRDVHVMREQLRDNPSGLLGAAAAAGLPDAVDRGLAERERRAVRELHAALDSVRHAELRQQLDRLVADPPLRRRASKSAKRTVPPLAGRAARAVDRAAEHADEPGLSRHDRDERLHDVRKAAKRARYAAELALPVGGEGARLLVERMTTLQTVLGDHQDQAMARRALTELSGTPVEESDTEPVGTAYRQALQATQDAAARRWTDNDRPGGADRPGQVDEQAARSSA